LHFIDQIIATVPYHVLQNNRTTTTTTTTTTTSTESHDFVGSRFVPVADV